MSIPTRDELQLEADLQQTPNQTPRADAALIEVGKVSDTQGGNFGSKFDNGAGFQFF